MRLESETCRRREIGLCIRAYVFVRSPGFGLSLVAESTTGVVLAVESMSAERTDSGELTLPEDLGEQTAKMLLEEIWKVYVNTDNASLLVVKTYAPRVAASIREIKASLFCSWLSGKRTCLKSRAAS